MVRIRALTALFVAVAPLCVHAKRLININFSRDPIKKIYTLSLESADEKPLFIVPVPPKADTIQKQPQQEFGFIDRFFNADKRRFTFDSTYMSQATENVAYQIPAQGTTKKLEGGKVQEKESDKVRVDIPSYSEAIKSITKQEAQYIIKQQAYFATTYNLENFIKMDDVTKAKMIAGAVLEKLYKIIQATLDLSGETHKSIPQFDIEDKKQVDANPLIVPLYNAVRDFGQVIGFEMPSLEPWHVQHRGKIVAGAGLALLAYLYYSNARNAGITGTKQVALPAQTTVPQPSSWYLQAKAAAQAKVGQVAQKVVGHITKAAVVDLEKAHGVQSQAMPTTTSWISGYIGRLFTKQLAEAQGFIPKTMNPSWPDWVAAKGVNWYVTNYGASWAGWTPK